MVVVGDMAKTENGRPGEYEFKEFHVKLDAASDIRGEVYLIIATDSGFEATTSYYLDDITVSLDETIQPIAVRGQAVQMLFHVMDRASAGPKDCTFQDVAEDHPHAEAIAWAQQHGCVSGYGDGRFGPEDSIKGIEKTSPWAKDAVVWAMANGFPRPTETISPQSLISVEEIAYSLSHIAFQSGQSIISFFC